MKYSSPAVTRHKHRRSPYGECGLKYDNVMMYSTLHLSLPVWGVWIEILAPAVNTASKGVAPRMGSVD